MFIELHYLLETTENGATPKGEAFLANLDAIERIRPFNENHSSVYFKNKPLFTAVYESYADISWYLGQFDQKLGG